MIKHAEHFHGSDLEKIEKIYGIKKEEIISFSANVNPLGLSPLLRERLKDCLNVITTYPDREYTELRRTIGAYCHADSEHILVGNGSTELISAIINTIKPKQACLVAPTYSEYEREITLSGGNCVYYRLQPENDFAFSVKELFSLLADKGLSGKELPAQEFSPEGASLFVICNPNNPTSSALWHAELEEILGFCAAHHIFVMIDETYIEFTENYESVTAVGFLKKYHNFIILRGISKFFASPGLRLGYGLTSNTDLLKKVNEIKNPWSINSLADAAGKILFTDTDYIHRTKELIFAERRRVCTALRAIPGLKVYEPFANFVLVKIEKEEVNADMLFDTAIRRSLMLRNCSSFEGLDNTFFRICFMMPEDNDRLLSCISHICS